ncbi:DNA-directed RNA polymerase sigma-70 factor [Rhizocola hellebori]|uniref:DNA-directed RNA polymerase sigma-70 factor n=1 Tax=Rhizocola hellebori TaxID=1392758 RepID=A0A8J3Q3U9_9ACTN|nr:SigE family RNA polymerase sigma factor [Rhizocola hellebori]GIH03345.1 DNA-directed RNA polymerase sigma-70 factor [Rhizocola hellebori]
MTEPDRFREFMELRYGDLLRTAFLLTGSTHAAEDLVQTVLLKVYKRFHTIEEPYPYLRRAMVNHHINLWRRIGSRELLSVFTPDLAEPDISTAFVQRAELMEALAQLPPKMRAVLVLRYWEDLSEADTAAALGCSLGSVKAQASRGLARLRDILRAEQVTTTRVAEGWA